MGNLPEDPTSCVSPEPWLLLLWREGGEHPQHKTRTSSKRRFESHQTKPNPSSCREGNNQIGQEPVTVQGSRSCCCDSNSLPFAPGSHGLGVHPEAQHAFWGCLSAHTLALSQAASGPPCPPLPRQLEHLVVELLTAEWTA